jgi:hypothetical protein
MKAMNAYDRQRTMKLLREREWTTSFNVSQRDPTVGSIYLALLEGSQCLERQDAEVDYWFTCAYSETEKAHGHGVLATTLTHRQVQACFSRGCNKPVLRDIYDKERLIDYQVKQALEGTQLTKRNDQCEENFPQ